VKRADSIAIHAFGLTLTSFGMVYAVAALARCAPQAARRAIKPAALWLNAARYKVSEEHVDWLNYNRQRMHQLALFDGADAKYYRREALRLEAQEHQQRLLQRRIRAQRDRFHKW
jgi:CO/xanthine dehydrogenase Mo-binding subunit